MAVIQVNHQQLRDAAQAISDYCDAQDREMRSAKSEIRTLLDNDWIGQDAIAFSAKWEGVDGRESVTVTLRDSLKNLSEGLSECAKAYQRAQAEVYSAADRLPKYLIW